MGQRVLQTKHLDSNNITSVKTYDPYERVVKRETLNPDGNVIAGEEMDYDAHGNLLKQQNHIYSNDRHLRTLVTSHCYNNRNQIKSHTRAFDTPFARTTRYTYTPTGLLAGKTKPDGITLLYSYDPLSYLKTISSSDENLSLKFNFNHLGQLIQASDGNNAIQRTLDLSGNILEERFSTGLVINKTYDAFDRPLSLSLLDQGQVLYGYNPLFLKSVSRLASGNILYTHQYNDYDLSGHLETESLIGNLGQVRHKTDLMGRNTSISSPYFTQTCAYDAEDNLVNTTINGADFQYGYDDLYQLTSEAGTDHSESYAYDSNFNCIQENGDSRKYNELDELLSADNIECTYDLNGNLTSKKTPKETFNFEYDTLNQLVEVRSRTCKLEMGYDPLGRRLSKTCYKSVSAGWERAYAENYLYDGESDIGAFSPDGKALQLRICGLASHKNVSTTVAMELEGQVFSPLHDVQGNIRSLVDPATGQHVADYSYTAFGQEQRLAEGPFNPWRYASKRIDAETNLINFGKRYYDPQLGRWLTTDPAGFVDGMNLYAYLQNNPFRYVDPDGRFAIPLVFIPLLEIAFDGLLTWLTAEVVVGAVTVAAVGVAAYELERHFDESNRSESLMHNESVGEEVVKDEKKKGKRKPVIQDLPFPVRPLPKDKNGVPIPDTDAPHTQLGTRHSESGKYPQAREFDSTGKPVRDLDFTDHGNPGKHPSPHQHIHEENITGGTRERGTAKPIPEWRYE